MNPASAKIRDWRNDPVLFVRENFKVEPDEWQMEGLRAISGANPGRKRLALKSGAGPGKTAELAWAGLHRLSCYGAKGEHPKGLAVSVTRDNLDRNLWPELAKWMGRSEYLSTAFTWTKTQIFANDHPATWHLSACGYAASADPETIGRTLSGLHGDYPFALIDESGDMSPAIARSAEQALSKCVDGLIATAGNTTSHQGLLYSVCTHDRENWTIISITGDPDDPKRSPRVDLEWAKSQIAKYGRDNPWVMAFVLGQFPPGSINSILTVDEVEAAMGRHLTPDQYDWSQKRLGVDVARFGDDRTVIFPRQGLAAFPPVVMRVARTTDIAARVAAAKAKWGSEMELVDDTGHWGHGVIDNLIAAGHSPLGIQFHGPALDPRYKNRRAEGWMTMAEAIRGGMALPNIPELVGELTTPTYTFNQGKFQLEDKDQVKKRLGRSPDLADALALTFMFPDMPKSDPLRTSLGLDKRGKVESEWDPYKEVS